jgi:hypothetical protein
MSSQSRDDSARRAVSRRTFIASALAGGTAAATLPWRPRGALAQGAPHRIDMHHHLSPPAHIEALRRAKLGSPPTFNWSVQLEALGLRFA